MHTADADSEVLRIGHTRVDELTAERVSLSAGAERKDPEHETFATCVCELDADAATRVRESGIIVQAIRSLKEPVLAGKASANMAETRAHQTLYSVFELR